MTDQSNEIRAFLERRYEEIAESHTVGADGFSTCVALTARMDAGLRMAFDTLSPGIREHIAVFGLGGYGRGELFPHSDVDIMILCAPRGAGEEAHAAAKEFLHLLWDAGVDVGHSVRTVDETMALHGTSLDAWTSVLESRFLFGSAELAEVLRGRLTSVVRRGMDAWFIKGVFEDRRARLERFGNSVKLLEPNIKKSAGGLRDVHAVYWLHRANDQRYFMSLNGAVPASVPFASALLSNSELEQEQYDRMLQALGFLFRVRHDMHFQRETQHDTLEYAMQLAVAERLGYRVEADLRPVEVFMRDYYRYARTIHALNLQLCETFRDAVEPVRPGGSAGEKVLDLFSVENGQIAIQKGFDRFTSPVPVLEAFTLAAERECDFDFHLRAAIERSADVLARDHGSEAEVASLFRRIVRSKRVAATLHEMNNLGVLGAFIPEFGRLVAFFQHNVYHYFTADEHTMIALANAERLRLQQGPLHDVFRLLRRKDVLYMAILLHDIAKPLGVADHEITGVEIARTVLSRLGMEDLIPEVTFLIRNHLAMEQVAFRRNIHDLSTIREFSGRFERPELLDYLYVLTYADLSAVNRNVWTEWKASMLQDLYQRTAEILRRNLRGEQIDLFQQARRDAAAEQIVTTLSSELPREDVERHLQGMQSNAYVAVFTEKEIGQHIQKAQAGETVSALVSQSEGYTEVTLIAKDAPFALSKFCAVLSANDANIFDANVFTRTDGIIIDRFRVFDASAKKHLDLRVCEKIEEDLVQVMNGQLDIDHLFREHHRKWKRRPKPTVNPAIRTDVRFEDTPTHTIIDVYAQDSVGFLYKITETISRLGLDIYFAKIATRMDGIIDAFYVLDRTGNPVKNEDQRESIRKDILETIKSMAEMELQGE
jgi:[protein-PII] uridylyltransferase